MPYIVLVIGLVIIYIALRKGQNTSNSSVRFETALKNNLKLNELEIMKSELLELSSRVEDIEKALLILNETIYKNTEQNTEPYEKTQNEILYQESKNTSDENDINSMIYKLYDKGMSIDEICSTLMIGKGEALLRIGLRKQKS